MKIGCCTSALTRYYSLPEAVERIARLGFASVEINVSGRGFFAPEMSAATVERIFAALNGRGLALNLHVDLNDICSYSHERRQPFDALLRELVEPFFAWGERAAVKTITFDPVYRHPYRNALGAASFLAADAILRLFGKGNAALASRFRPRETAEALRWAAAQSVGIPVGLENFSRGTALPEDFTALRELAGGKWGILLDVGHAHLCIAKGLVAARTLSQYIASLPLPVIDVHVSDNDGVRDRHAPPGEGTADLRSAVDGLKNIGYAGDLMLEVLPASRETAEETLLSSRKMLEDLIQ